MTFALKLKPSIFFQGVIDFNLFLRLYKTVYALKIITITNWITTRERPNNKYYRFIFSDREKRLLTETQITKENTWMANKNVKKKFRIIRKKGNRK